VATAQTATFAFTPLDEGAYVAAVTVSDLDDGGRQYRDDLQLVVSNAAPVVSVGGAVAATAGSTWTRAVSFTDPGRDTWTAQIDFGDGSAIVNVPASELSDRSFDISHAYVDAGAYTVTVEVHDGDGGLGTAALDVGVTRAPIAASQALNALDATAIDREAVGLEPSELPTIPAEAVATASAAAAVVGDVSAMTSALASRTMVTAEPQPAIAASGGLIDWSLDGLAATTPPVAVDPSPSWVRELLEDISVSEALDPNRDIAISIPEPVEV
jgi:hypothetical protein